MMACSCSCCSSLLLAGVRECNIGKDEDVGGGSEQEQLGVLDVEAADQQEALCTWWHTSFVAVSAIKRNLRGEKEPMFM